MNRQDYYNFFGVKNTHKDKVFKPIEVQEVVEKSADKAILKAIYDLDPVTKLPTGDIAMFVSDKCSPEVKAYIASNLMADISGNKVGVLPDGLDEETAFALERRSDEPLIAWKQRVSDFYTKQVETYNMAIENSNHEKEVKFAE